MDIVIKIVYLAGALRGNFITKFFNLRKAKRIARELWYNGVAVFSPHMNSGWIDSPQTDKFILPVCLEMLKRCNILFVMDNWQNSEGTKDEIRLALELKMPIYFNKDLMISNVKNNEVDKWKEYLYEKIPEFLKKLYSGE